MHCPDGSDHERAGWHLCLAAATTQEVVSSRTSGMGARSVRQLLADSVIGQLGQ
jgi:hypothetical protein